jgi:hypothetical protein
MYTISKHVRSKHTAGREKERCTFFISIKGHKELGMEAWCDQVTGLSNQL